MEKIAPLIGARGGLEEGLGIEDKDGNKTILRFETLPELRKLFRSEQSQGGKRLYRKGE